MWILLLKKFGLSFLTLLGLLAGVFLWALTIYPFNFPYLLQLPFDETNGVTATVFALLFVCIVTVAVRTKWCYETDLFFLQKDEKPRPLVVRIITSQEFLADIIVFAMWVLGIYTTAAITSETAPVWYVAALTVLAITVVATAVFAPLDCLLYVIARKKADKKLRKREET